jgi:hypothetical protein
VFHEIFFAGLFHRPLIRFFPDAGFSIGRFRCGGNRTARICPFLFGPAVRQNFDSPCPYWPSVSLTALHRKLNIALSYRRDFALGTRPSRCNI